MVRKRYNRNYPKMYKDKKGGKKGWIVAHYGFQGKKSEAHYKKSEYKMAKRHLRNLRKSWNDVLY